MSKRSEYKKFYKEDKFARKFWCQRARLNQTRLDKKQGVKKIRQKNKISVDNSNEE